eukprot:scaffold442_cov397-Prasinococcus_capsulatus_cf.AAC.37
MADPVGWYEVARLVKVGQQLRLALCLAQLVYHGSGVLHVHNGDNTPSSTRSGPATHAARSASTHLRDRKRLHASRLVWNASDTRAIPETISQRPGSACIAPRGGCPWTPAPAWRVVSPRQICGQRRSCSLHGRMGCARSSYT